MDRSERRSVKAGIDKDDCRKNRTQQKVELRKATTEEGLQKRRNMLADVNVEIEPPVTPEAASSTLAAQGAIVLGFVERNGPAEEFEDAFQATKHLRKQLSLARNPPIDDVIHAGLVPAFVTMLGHPDTKLQFEAAWCLTNIASGTSKQCEKVVNNNGVPALVGLLTSPSIDVSEQAVWAIGNIVGDCPAMRDLVLQNGASDKIVQLVEVTASSGQMGPLRNAVWALSNLVRGKPQPAMPHVTRVLPVLAKLLMLQDEEVLMDTCWALSYISDGGDDRIDAVVQHGAVVPLMNVLRERTETRTRTPALRTLCNILTGSHAATQVVIDAGILDVLPEAIKATKSQTRKEACWAISNVAAGTTEQVDMVMRSPLLASVIDRLGNDDFEVKKEAAWVVANILHSFSSEPTNMHAAQRANHLVQLGAIAPMVAMLEVNDAAMQKLMLEAIGTLLSAGDLLGSAKGNNPFLVPFDEAEGIDKLESLQEHHNEEIYQKAIALLEKYFGEDGDEDENLLPNVANGGFAFGAAAPVVGGFSFNAAPIDVM